MLAMPETSHQAKVALVKIQLLGRPQALETTVELETVT